MTKSTMHTMTQTLCSLAKIYKTPYLLTLGYQASEFIQPLENYVFSITCHQHIGNCWNKTWFDCMQIIKCLEILAFKTETLTNWVYQNRCVLETHKSAKTTDKSCYYQETWY